jgi:hypothetical protein
MIFLFHTLGAWWLYRIVMWLKKHRDTIKKKGKAWYALGYLFAFFALIFDVLYNLVYGTILQMGIGTLLFTSTLQRIRKNPKAFYSWQVSTAKYICEKMLNPYDPSGTHC